MKFKVGDRVKITKIQDPSVLWNLNGEMDYLDGKTIKIEKIVDGYDEIEIDNWCVSFDCLTWVGKEKKFIPKFILQYMLKEDPIEEFETIKEVRNRIKELLENPDLKRESIVVYELKKKLSVSIKNQVIIK